MLLAISISEQSSLYPYVPMRDDQTPSGPEKTDAEPTVLKNMPQGLQALMARAGKQKSAPPVHLWEPDYCGELDMRIASDGTWFYLGSPIGREALVRLFASVLRKDEDGKTYLVTPVEKIGIRVEDAPFQAVEMIEEETGSKDKGERGGTRLTFRTNVGDVVSVGREHPFRFALEDETAGLKAYISVRGRLEARLSRALMYDLINLAVEGEGVHAGQFGVWSDGLFFPICSMQALEQFEAALI